MTRALLFLIIILTAWSPNTKSTSEPDLLQQKNEIENAMKKGVAYLLEKQNKDGSWGAPKSYPINYSEIGIYRLALGSHKGVRLACTAICTLGLMDYPFQNKKIDDSIEAAINYCLKNWKSPYDQYTSFNIYGYSYNLDFLSTLFNSPRGKKYRETITKIVPKIVEKLKVLQQHQGGWSYYSGPDHGGSSMSFTTARIILSLQKAKIAGIKFNYGVLNDAVRFLKTTKISDGSFIYDGRFVHYVAHQVETLGNVGRTQICGLALHRVQGGFTKKDLLHWTKELYKNGAYLEIGRKRLIPHRDAPNNISGYFFFYAYYYSTEIMETELNGESLNKEWSDMVSNIMRTQEKDGSWYDTLFYGYGKKWGTGMAISCLARCHRAVLSK